MLNMEKTEPITDRPVARIQVHHNQKEFNNFIINSDGLQEKAVSSSRMEPGRFTGSQVQQDCPWQAGSVTGRQIQ